MKNIVKQRITYLALVGFLFSAIGCNDEFLDVPVTGQVSESQLASASGLDGLLVGVYSVLNGRGSGWYGGSSNWVWGSVRGGDANKGSDAGDQAVVVPVARFEVDPVNGPVSSKWRGSFEGVSRANIFLANLEASAESVTEERAITMEAEARFLRAHYYFELKKNFDKAPYVDETQDIATGATEVPNDKDLWPMIEADLQFAYDNLPETQAQTGRANKWAAASYLAKAYMFQSKFADAKALFDMIIADGQTSNGLKYGLVDNYGELFRGSFENSQESIFAFQAATNTGSIDNTNQDFVLNYPYNTGPDGPAGCCGFFQPSFDLVNSHRTVNGLPLLNNAYRNPGNELTNDQGIKSDEAFTPDQGPLDPRLDHSVGRRGITFLDWIEHPGLDWIRDQRYGGPYTAKKFAFEKGEEGTYQDGSSWTAGYSSINFMLIRFADVLLMAAEAEIEAGSLEKAREYVNRVRQRAANSFLLDENGDPEANYSVSLYTAPWSDQAAARDAVRFERKLELALEGHRFYDLIRWGIAGEVINSYLDYEGEKLPTNLRGANFTPGKDEYLPIPQAQIDLQGKDILTQNPGY